MKRLLLILMFGMMFGMMFGKNYALEFDGIDYVQIPNLIDSPSNYGYTISFNFKAYEIKESNMLGNGDGISGIYVGITDDGRLTFSVANPILSTAQNTILPNVWYSVIVSTTGYTNHKIYINGINTDYTCQGNANCGADISSPGREIYIGQSSGFDNDYFNGLIDDVIIIEDYLTANEVSQFNLEEPENIFNILGYWNFNAGEGDIVYDYSGNYNDGNIFDAQFICIDPICLTITIIDESFQFDLSQGANLLSCPCVNETPLEDAIPSDILYNNLTGIITQGSAATNLGGNWVGSLNGLGGGKGYWFISNGDAEFNYTCSE